MTTEQQPPTVPRPARRRPWLWIVIAGTAVAVVLVAVLIGAEMTNNRQNSATGTSAPHAILARMLSQTNDTAVTAGGTWTFEDKSAWDPTDTSGYIGDPCSGSASGAQHYQLIIYSSGAVDPAAAAARIAKHWGTLGYSVRTVVPTQTDNFDYTEMSADLADGAGLGYTVSKKISGIQGASECSTDPALSTKTR